MEEKNGEAESETFDDADYNIPIENKGFAHTIAIAVSVILPITMIVSLILQSGFMGLLNFRVLIIIPIIAILYFIVKYTDDFGSVSVENIEKQYDNIIIIEPVGISSKDDIKRPKRIGVHTSDGTIVPFTFITRYAYENNYTLGKHNGILTVKDGKAAVLVEDTNDD